MTFNFLVNNVFTYRDRRHCGRAVELCRFVRADLEALNLLALKPPAVGCNWTQDRKIEQIAYAARNDRE